MSYLSTMRIIYNAVKVKNAELLEWFSITNSVNYDLQHYDTVILKVRNNEVVLIKPCSRSSVRAINQALRYIGISESCQDIVKAKIKQGETIDKSY